MNIPTTSPKRGRPRKYPELDKVVTRPVNLPPSTWLLLDEIRGSLSVSDWVFKQILQADLLRVYLAAQTD